MNVELKPAWMIRVMATATKTYQATHPIHGRV